MEIHVKESTIICPAQETPKHCLQVSDLDLIVPSNYVPTVYFYRRPSDCTNFFEVGLLKEALSKVLLPFYPVAGRLQKDENGKIEIICNGEGVSFLEAETSCAIDDLGDFSQGSKLLPLVPAVGDTKDVPSHPLFLTQVTYFKCGGVSLGTRLQHTLADGVSAYHIINSWAEMARGIPISIQPFFDRTILGVGVPTSPTFHHVEYDPHPSLNAPPTQNPEIISTSILGLSLDQIDTLKEKSKPDHEPTLKYSRMAILAAHIWRSVCRARGLSDDQATKLHFPTDGRHRLNPPLPSGFLGNVVFTTALTALSGDILTEPLNHTVNRIQKALKRMDDGYLKSALAYVKQQPDLTVLKKGGHIYKCPNLNIVGLANMPMYDANFGWGQPIFMRVVNTYYEGVAHIYRSPSNDGTLLVIINLAAHHVELFKKFFYEIFN